MRREVAVKPSHGTGARALGQTHPQGGPRHGDRSIKAPIKAGSNGASPAPHLGPEGPPTPSFPVPCRSEAEKEPGLHSPPFAQPIARRERFCGTRTPISGTPLASALLNSSDLRRLSYPQPGRSQRAKRICQDAAGRTLDQSALPCPGPTGYGPLLRFRDPQRHAVLAGH